MSKFLTKPCRDSLIGMQRKLVRLAETDPGERIVGLVVDHISDILTETARLDAEGVNHD